MTRTIRIEVETYAIIERLGKAEKRDPRNMLAVLIDEALKQREHIKQFAASKLEQT